MIPAPSKKKVNLEHYAPIARPMFSCYHVTYSGYFSISFGGEKEWIWATSDCHIVHNLLCTFPSLLCAKGDEKIPTISHVMACKQWLHNRSIKFTTIWENSNTNYTCTLTFNQVSGSHPTQLNCLCYFYKST